MSPRLLTFCLTFLAFAVAAFAESAGDIRRRMEQRLGALEELKAREVVGENNRGYAELRGNAAGADKLVGDENRDREAVYALIAQQTGSSTESVGRARAKQIAAHSRPGVWVQDESGQWKRK